MGLLKEISTKRHWGYDQKYSSLLRIMSSLSLSSPHAISQLVTWESDDSTLLQEIFMHYAMVIYFYASIAAVLLFFNKIGLG